MVYGAQLASLLGRPMDAASEFRIVLRCTHEETEQEGRWLAGAPSPGKARRRTHGGGQAKEQGGAADACVGRAVPVCARGRALIPAPQWRGALPSVTELGTPLDLQYWPLLRCCSGFWRCRTPSSRSAALQPLCSSSPRAWLRQSS